MNDQSKLARIFKALSVDSRLRIIELLKEQSLCVNALAHRLNMTAAAISQHLRILRDIDVVTADKKGYFVHYSLNEDTLSQWRELSDTFFKSEHGE